VSTSSDSFPEEESQQNNSIAEESTTSDSVQTNEQGREKAQPGEPVSADISSSTLPLEAQGETNGGPLGCCLGVTVGLLLSLSIAVLSRLYADQLAQIFSSWLSLVVRVVMILIALAAIIVCGYFGWKIGRNAYREYDPPVVKDRRRRRPVARVKR
jgi:uncharacterized membrane protein YdbT with pleckstrin-like domain